MTTKPDRSKCSTRRLATITAINSPASLTRFRPSKRSAKASASARSSGVAGVSFSSSAMIRASCLIDQNRARTLRARNKKKPRASGGSRTLGHAVAYRDPRGEEPRPGRNEHPQCLIAAPRGAGSGSKVVASCPSRPSRKTRCFGMVLDRRSKPFAMLQDLWIKHREWVCSSRSTTRRSTL